MPPFEFYCSVLSRPDRHGRTGRHRLLERLGPDAQEPIEAFLSQALAYERGHPASLEGFLHWLGLGAQQLKRDPEQARDAVRVMTVHGAKGLEAPVVFLADAGPQGGRRGDNRLLWLDDWGVPVWRPRKEERDSRCEVAAEADTRRERDERLRLLYVALTRARDRLYVTGWRPRKGGKDEASWHAMVRRALAEAPDVERFELELGRSYRGEALRLRRGVPGATAVPGAAERPAATTARPLPAWATSPAAEETAARPLAPSRLMPEEEPAPDSPAGAEARGRIRHGFLVHRLLQVLPGLPAAGWQEAGSRLLSRLAGDLDEAVLAALLAETLGVLRLPDLAPLFGPGSRPEQPVCGLVGGRMVAGQVDRLAVTADAVLIADYKTTRRPPTSLAGIPVAYLRQTAAYRSLLRDVYPGREVRAALVWTQGPRVTFLPPDLLDAQLRALHAAGANQPPA
jgi:ATP-dependent helicase/nuclease subunit A